MIKKQRYLALLLAILLVFSMPIYVSADKASKNVNSSPVRVQEVTDLRATNSETYLLSDGTYECVVYAEDKYYYDSSKSLQLIDNSIVPNGNILTSSSKAYKNAANQFDVYFSRTGVPQINLSSDGYGLTFSPLSSTKDERNTASTSSIASIGTVNNCETLDTLTFTGKNTVTYADVFSDTNLVYVLENGALKEYIILESNDAPNEFSFSFSLDGLSYQVIDEEHCFVNELGETVFSLAPLFAIDANGELTERVFYEVTPGSQKNTITVNVQLDKDYLYDSNRVFPVVVDPSVLISGQYNTYDTYVSSRYYSTNYYLNLYLRTGKDEDFYVRRTYIQFDLPYSIDADNVTSAYVGLKYSSGSIPNLKAYLVMQSWNRSTVTWSNAPSYSSTDTSSTCTVSSDNWCRTYVTSIVKKWLSGFAANYGLMIKDENESSTSHWTTFYSSDSGYPNRPELRIYYTTDQITYYYTLYKNSAAPNSLSSLKAYVDAASAAIDDYFNVSFVCQASGFLTALNQGSNCPEGESKICSASCGSLADCQSLHHKAAYRLLNVNESSSEMIFRFVDYPICRYRSDDGHIGLYGCANKYRNILVTLHAANVWNTTCHEMSHLIGARDEVCTGDQPCVMRYGTYVEDQWCSQCSMDIINYLG